MRRWQGIAVVALVALAACGARQAPQDTSPPAPRRTRYWPAWTLTIPEHMHAIRACLETREEPRYVLFVDSLITGATGVTTINYAGAVEHCAYHDGRLVRREPAATSAADFEKLPLFSPGAAQPSAPIGSVLEEVLDDDGVVIGWLFWPNAIDLREPEAGGES
jgi:hypothetical protein